MIWKFFADIIRSTLGSRKARAAAAALIVNYIIARYGIDLDDQTKTVLIGSVTTLAGILIYGTALEDAATKSTTATTPQDERK